MRGVVLLGGGLTVAVLLMAAWATDAWARRAHRAPDGFRLADRAPGAAVASFALSTLAAVAFVVVAWWGAFRYLEVRTMLDEGYWLGLGCLLLLLGAVSAGAIALVRALMQRVGRRARLGPGSLVVGAWPLVAGDPTPVTFQRRVHADAVLDKLEASLVCRRMRQGKDGAHQVLVGALPLGDGGAHVDEGVLTAHWSLEVPRSHRALADRLEAVGRSMDWWTGAAWRYTWACEVTTAFEGDPGDTAVFPLHVDAPGWASFPSRDTE